MAFDIVLHPCTRGHWPVTERGRREAQEKWSHVMPIDLREFAQPETTALLALAFVTGAPELAAAWGVDRSKLKWPSR